jgi:hypothetical protein
MRQLVGYAGALAEAIALAPGATAHHGFGTFLMNEDVEITGTVTKLDFVNPHSWLYLDVTQPDGKVVAMRCEMRSATTLRRSGWSPDLFPVGKKITITGSPDRYDPYSCYVSTLIFDDGSRIDRYGQLVASLKIGQGQRPEKLANGQPNISGDWAQEQVVMTDPRGQIGTLVPLSQVDEIRKTGDLQARGAIPGARNTEQADAQVEAARRNAAAGRGTAAAASPNRGGGAPGRAGGTPGRAGGAPGRAGGPPANLTAAGRAALAARPATDRFAMSCVFRSIVAEWGGEPVNRVTQRGDTITIQYGRLGVTRTIHMAMTEHPKAIEPSLTGHSIGRWDGDVLVVDTVGFAPGMLNGRLPHSDRLHVVERFRFDPKTRQLRRDYTARDPRFLTEAVTGTNTMDISNVPYGAEPCEDLTIDKDAKLGPRQAALPRR